MVLLTHTVLLSGKIEVSSTPVQGFIIPGDTEIMKVTAALLEKKLDVRPILYPSVPKGKERLRISIHAFNTKEEIELLISVLQHQ